MGGPGRAREIGRQTGTPVYVLKNGRIVDLTKERKQRHMGPAHTPKQGQYLAFIHHYTRVNGQPPAEADIQRFFRVPPPTVHMGAPKITGQPCDTLPTVLRDAAPEWLDMLERCWRKPS